MNPPVPELTDAQKEAIVREWACEQLKDSRLMCLPADLARLLVQYANDAAIAAHCAQPIEVAKEMMWRADKPQIHNCKCGAIIVWCYCKIYGGTSCDHAGCEAYVCAACVNMCDECDEAECTNHKGCDPDLASIHTCSVCQHRQCKECYEDVCWECQSCKHVLCLRCAQITDENIVACRDGYGCTRDCIPVA